MRQWPDRCVDLIYLDPPFNSNADYNILFGASDGVTAQVRAFSDTWKWDEAAVERTNSILNATAHPAHAAIQGLHVMIGPSGMLAYLTYMAERLAEMRRLLRPTGSIYLHCDDTASHYLKVVMDAIFGAKHYRNDIAWRRATAHNDPHRFGRVLDHILYYAGGDRPHWDGDAVTTDKTADQLQAAYPATDDRGRYRSSDLTGAGVSNKESGQPWHGYDVSARGRHWSAPRTGAYAAYIEREFIPGYRQIQGVHARLEALDQAGLIHHPKRGFWPGLKRYAAAERGNPPQNLILEPAGFTNFNRGQGEYLGYPTQKPQPLLEYLIKAATKPNDFVLDPFCGCGTTITAAQNLGRRWAGIDISSFAIDIVQERRLDPLGITATIEGIPTDIESARRLAQDKPFDFETWAVYLVPGLAPNAKQRGDRGVDGRGKLVSIPEDGDSQLVLAQVKGGHFTINQLRDFMYVVEREQAAIGIFITLEPAGSGARAEAAKAGSVVIGAAKFPRVMLWSIQVYFDQQGPPHLPPMLDPFTGQPMLMQRGLPM